MRAWCKCHNWWFQLYLDSNPIVCLYTPFFLWKWKKFTISWCFHPTCVVCNNGRKKPWIITLPTKIAIINAQIPSHRISPLGESLSLPKIVPYFQPFFMTPLREDTGKPVAPWVSSPVLPSPRPVSQVPATVRLQGEWTEKNVLPFLKKKKASLGILFCIHIQ